MQHAPIFFQDWYNVERTITLSIVGYAALFTMLPRMIQMGPRLFSSEEWMTRKQRLPHAV